MQAAPPLESGLSLTQLGAMLNARRALIAAVFMATVGVAIVMSLVLPKSYTSYAELYIDYRGTDPISGRQFSATQDESYLATQIDIIKSDDVARYILDATKAYDDPEVRESIQKRGEEFVRANLIKAIMRDLEVVPKRNSRVLELHFSSQDPVFARDALNAAIKGYIEINNRIHSAPAKSRQEQYSTQLSSLRTEIDRIQKEITAYQQEVGILDADERLDTGSRQFSELSSRLLTVQAAQSEAGARYRSIQSQVAAGTRPQDIAEIARTEVVREVKARLIEADGRLFEASGVLGKNHPRYKALEADRQALQSLLEREAANVLKSLELDARRHADQANGLAAEMTARQQQLLEMKKHRDVLASYQRQLNSAQQVYTSAVARYDEILIQSNVTSPTMAVLQWAERPLRHSKPKLISNVIVSLPGGLFLGLVLALLLELSYRRVRCLEDLQNSLPVPMLGASS